MPVGLLYLHGRTDYGDAIEDEWLIVYILRELTKSHPNLWVRVADTDGEFLLVEAASVLPKWLDPEIDHYRVWIHQSELLIISPQSSESSLNTQNPVSVLSLAQAIESLKSEPKSAVRYPSVEAEAFYRLEKYPGQIEKSLHYSLVTMPRKLAYIIHSVPRSVAPAVERFYLRDPFSLKPINSLSDPLVFPPVDLVTVSVGFSKVMFAQLKSQQFDFPPRWQDAIRKVTASTIIQEEVHENLRKLEIGVKLTCGYEMLAVKADSNKSTIVREAAIFLKDLEEDGNIALPSDEKLQSLGGCLRNDDESWLDIDYEDFERELEGKQSRDTGSAKSGFGDGHTRANLRKIVSRFEAFLGDDKAGLEGAEIGNVHSDESDGLDSGDDDGDSEDREVIFDDKTFSAIMRGMAGLASTHIANVKAEKDDGTPEKMLGIKSSDIHDCEDSREIVELSVQMEAELKKYGVLSLDPPPSDQLPGLEGRKGAMPQQLLQNRSDEHPAAPDGYETEVDIDLNLAKNLLESFKSQVGMAGPAGNLLGIMGLQLPRDDDNGDEDEGKDANNEAYYNL